MSLVYRRISAFIIDLLLISFLTVMICQVSFFNPRFDAYSESYDIVNKKVSDLGEKVYQKIKENDANPVEILKIFNSVSKDTYKLEVNTLFIYLWYLVFSILYFGVFAYFANGQTLGKKIFKLKLVNKDESNISLSKCIARTLMHGSSIYMGINIFIIFNILGMIIFKDYSFMIYKFVIQLISYIVELCYLILLLVNKDRRTVNDLLFKTKVIDVKKV